MLDKDSRIPTAGEVIKVKAVILRIEKVFYAIVCFPFSLFCFLFKKLKSFFLCFFQWYFKNKLSKHNFLPNHKVQDVKEDGSLDVTFLQKKGDHYTVEETVNQIIPGPPNFYSISLVCPLSFHVRGDNFFFLV